MKVVWTPQARRDRAAIFDHIAADSPAAAARMDQRFSDAASQLVNFPRRGRPGPVQGTRELLPHETFRLIYEIEGETVWLLALVHTARQWPAFD